MRGAGPLGRSDPVDLGRDYLMRRAWRAPAESTPRDLFWRAAAVLGYRRLWLYVQPTSGHAHPGGSDVRAVRESDLAAYRAARPDTPPGEVRRRLRAGDRCSGLWRNGQLVAHRWVSCGWAEVTYLGVTVELGPGVLHHYDVHTIPAERRRYAQSRLTTAMFAEASNEGASAVFFTVLPENRAMRAFLPVEATRVGTLTSVGFGRHRLPILRGGHACILGVRPGHRTPR